MHRKSIPFLAVIVIAIVCTSSQILSAQPVSKTFDVKDFTQVDLGTAADVYLGTGDFVVKVEASSQDIMDQLDIHTDGNALKIDKKKHGWDNWNWPAHSSCKVYINLPKLEGIAVAGSGDVYAQNDFSGDKLKIAMSGSGDVNMKNITYANLAVSISGSGNVTMEGGTATSADFHVSGSGNVKVSKINGDQASAEVAGSGNLNLGKFSKLSVNVAGSGDVSYSGKPATLDKHVSGSGDVYEK